MLEELPLEIRAVFAPPPALTFTKLICATVTGETFTWVTSALLKTKTWPAVTPSISAALSSIGSAAAGSAAKAIEDNDNMGTATSVARSDFFISDSPKVKS
jgi:hypothetical protein